MLLYGQISFSLLIWKNSFNVLVKILLYRYFRFRDDENKHDYSASELWHVNTHFRPLGHRAPVNAYFATIFFLLPLCFIAENVSKSVGSLVLMLFYAIIKIVYFYIEAVDVSRQTGVPSETTNLSCQTLPKIVKWWLFCIVEFKLICGHYYSSPFE